jgi:cell division protein FtsB
MKKKSEDRSSEKKVRNAPSASKAARVIPSRIWVEAGRALWRSLAFREKALVVMGILAPTLDQVSRLASLGVTMKAVGRGIRQPLDLDSRLWLGLLILGAFGITGLIQIFSKRVQQNSKIQVTRILRRLYGRMVAGAAMLPLEEREKEVANLVSEERSFMTSGTSGISATLDFASEIFIVVVLLVIVTWFNWIVGAIILGAGLVALVTLKFRIKTSERKENENLVETRKTMIQQLERIGEERRNPEVLIRAYADNEFDKHTFAEQEQKTSLQRKISSAMNFGSAILMAVVFFLVSSEGAFDEHKVVWMVVFIFGLRMVVAQGKSAMVSWGEILAAKNSLMVLAKASLMPPPVPIEDEGDDGESDLVPGLSVKTGSGPRIVNYAFSGLNGADIVSREPLVLEMTVESGAEVRGIYWSFAIMPLGRPEYLISKTADDCGITWDLPAGRSRFRMVSGPVWLPAGTYAVRVGLAKGNRLLDFSGAKGTQATITVLPDEEAKRSVQTRAASDVVVMDVEWELEFLRVKSERGKALTEN